MYKDVLSGKECVGNEESAWWRGKERLGDVLPALYCDRSPTRMLPLNTPTLEEHESCPPAPSPPLRAVTKRQPLTRFCCILTQDFSARSFLSFLAPFCLFYYPCFFVLFFPLQGMHAGTAGCNCSTVSLQHIEVSIVTLPPRTFTGNSIFRPSFFLAFLCNLVMKGVRREVSEDEGEVSLIRGGHDGSSDALWSGVFIMVTARG